MDAAAYVTATGAEVPEQLFTVACTEYELGCVTVVDCVVAPVDQRCAGDGEEVSVTLPPLGQMAVEPLAVIVGVGYGEMTMTTEASAEQPLASVAVTVYVPAWVTLMSAVFAPVDQWYVDAPVVR